MGHIGWSEISSTARLRAQLEALGDQFWLRPAIIIVLCAGLAVTLTWFGQSTTLGGLVSRSDWTYSGGGDGARSLLSSVASSSIGVASTVFSITIAALSLASGQMGPRLLRNFVRDSRNQFVLGIFLGTFVYALVVLRTIRTTQEGAAFVPNVAITGAIVLALVCVGTLVWFVHHIATSINVEQVVAAVHRDLCRAVLVRTTAQPDRSAPAGPVHGPSVQIDDFGYLQAIDLEGLADWAVEHEVDIRLKIKPGEFLPTGAAVGRLSREVPGASEALQRALTFGRRPAALQDLEYSIRQLTEIGVRALSPGINDPMTAGSVLEHFGDVLCRIAPRHLESGIVTRADRAVVAYPAPTYDGLCDGMFHMIRQNAAGSVFVLVRALDVLTLVAEVEHLPERRDSLRRHADLILVDANETMKDAAGLADLEERHANVLRVVAA